MLLRLFYVITAVCFLTAHGLAIQKIAALASGSTTAPSINPTSGD